MTDTKETLEKCLVETLSQLQRYILIGFGSSLFFFLLVAGDTKSVDAPIGPVVILVSKPTAMAIAISIYWVVGVIATFFVSRIDNIISLLRDDELVMAVVMYPSVLTTQPNGIRVGLTVLPPLFVIIGLMINFGDKLVDIGPLFGTFVLVLPYLYLAKDLVTPIGNSVREKRAIKIVKKHLEKEDKTVPDTTEFSTVHSTEVISVVFVDNDEANYYSVLNIGSNIMKLSDREVTELRLTKKSSRR